MPTYRYISFSINYHKLNYPSSQKFSYTKMQRNFSRQNYMKNFYDNSNDSWNIITRRVYSKCSILIRQSFARYQSGSLSDLIRQLKIEINLYLTGNNVNRSSSSNELSLFKTCFDKQKFRTVRSLFHNYKMKAVLEQLKQNYNELKERFQRFNKNQENSQKKRKTYFEKTEETCSAKKQK